jgi:hypothetical protein
MSPDFEVLGLRTSLRLAYKRAWANITRSGAAKHALESQEFKCDRRISRRKDFPDLLARMELRRPVTRIFVMGCGRSGTWLLYSLLSRVMDAYTVFDEVDVGRFVRIRSHKPVHLLKRCYKSFESAHLIPQSIGVAWIVRHPFDVLTSHHPVRNSENDFHIEPGRWNGEMDALRHFVEEGRNGIVLRYEDLVAEPDKTLQQVAATFGQELSGSASDLVSALDIPTQIRETMQGLRRVTTDSVERWKSRPEFAARLKAVAPLIRERLPWVVDRFGYNIELPG